MGYGLGVDLGTTFTAAAICRDDEAEIVDLGERSAVVPSVVWASPDGSTLVGEGALRRGAREPTRMAREFKRRFGDPVPLILGGAPYAAETLAARVLRHVCEIVGEREGGAPEQIVVTHPASWGEYKLDALRQAVTSAELGPIRLLGEPHAAALSYAAAERVTVGSTLLVYDLGGGTFDAAILRKTHAGFELAGPPEGLERLGGVDFDEAVLNFVRAAVSSSVKDPDLDNVVAMTMLARLRDECVAAKEALSTDTETTIPVLLPEVQTEVRLVRSEFEAMIRPPLDETLAATRRAISAAALESNEVDVVLLVGGSSRIPIVSRQVSAALHLPVAVDAHPKHGVALGAATVAFNSTQRVSRDPVAALSSHETPPPHKSVTISRSERDDSLATRQQERWASSLPPSLSRRNQKPKHPQRILVVCVALFSVSMAAVIFFVVSGLSGIDSPGSSNTPAVAAIGYAKFPTVRWLTPARYSSDHRGTLAAGETVEIRCAVPGGDLWSSSGVAEWVVGVDNLYYAVSDLTVSTRSVPDCNRTRPQPVTVPS